MRGGGVNVFFHVGIGTTSLARRRGNILCRVGIRTTDLVQGVWG